MMNSPSPLAQKLMESFHKLNRLQKHQLSVSGLAPSEFFLLFHIKKKTKPNEQGIKLSDISKHLMVTAPTVTQLIKNLEKQGFIERKTDENDKRSVRVKLTDKGQNEVNKTWTEFMNNYHEIVEHIGEEKTKDLIDLLSIIFDYLHKKSDKNCCKHCLGGKCND